MSSICLCRCCMPVLTSGWVEVSSDGQAQYHWWTDKLKQAYILLWVLLRWVLMNAICCQVLIWWGDFPCSRVLMSRRFATLEDLSSSAWARQHSYAPPSKFTVQFSHYVQHLQTNTSCTSTALCCREWITGRDIKWIFSWTFKLSVGLCRQALSFHAVSEQKHRQRESTP